MVNSKLICVLDLHVRELDRLDHAFIPTQFFIFKSSNSYMVLMAGFLTPSLLKLLL